MRGSKSKLPLHSRESFSEHAAKVVDGDEKSSRLGLLGHLLGARLLRGVREGWTGWAVRPLCLACTAREARAASPQASACRLKISWGRPSALTAA